MKLITELNKHPYDGGVELVPSIRIKFKGHKNSYRFRFIKLSIFGLVIGLRTNYDWENKWGYKTINNVPHIDREEDPKEIISCK